MIFLVAAIVSLVVICVFSFLSNIVFDTFRNKDERYMNDWEW